VIPLTKVRILQPFLYFLLLNDGAKWNSFLCLKIMYTVIKKKLTFVQNFVHLVPKLIQHAIAIGPIKDLDTGSYFSQNFVHLAPKLIQDVIAIGSIENQDTSSCFCTKLLKKNLVFLNKIQHRSII
jgi:hypothetical protein